MPNRNNSIKMAYLTALEYSKENTIEKITELDNQGIDYIELMIPFSDPVAEDPKIQDASVRAISNGCTLEKIFLLLKEIQGTIGSKIILSFYANTAFRYGYDRFCKAAKDCGVTGFIVEDLPFEEKHELEDVADNYEIFIVTIIADYIKERIRPMAKDARGLICISPFLKNSLDDREFQDVIDTIKKESDLPLLSLSENNKNERYLTSI